MGFVRTDFKPGDTTGTAPSIHTYTTTDAIADCNTEGYFNDISDILSAGDLLYLQTSTGTTRVATLAQVLTNAAGVVDIADGTTLAATDND